MLDEIFDEEVISSPRFWVASIAAIGLLWMLMTYWESMGYENVGIVSLTLGSKIFFSILAIVFAYVWTMWKSDD